MYVQVAINLVLTTCVRVCDFEGGASGAKVLLWLKHGFAFNGARRCRCGCCHSVLAY